MVLARDRQQNDRYFADVMLDEEGGTTEHSDSPSVTSAVSTESAGASKDHGHAPTDSGARYASLCLPPTNSLIRTNHFLLVPFIFALTLRYYVYSNFIFWQ